MKKKPDSQMKPYIGKGDEVLKALMAFKDNDEVKAAVETLKKHMA